MSCRCVLIQSVIRWERQMWQRDQVCTDMSSLFSPVRTCPVLPTPGPATNCRFVPCDQHLGQAQYHTDRLHRARPQLKTDLLELQILQFLCFAFPWGFRNSRTVGAHTVDLKFTAQVLSNSLQSGWGMWSYSCPSGVSDHGPFIQGKGTERDLALLIILCASCVPPACCLTW